MDKRTEYIAAIKAKKFQVKQYLNSINIFDFSNLLKELKDVFYMYGFTPDDVKRFLSYSGTYAEYSSGELLEIDGMINSLLFQLKYKLKK